MILCNGFPKSGTHALARACELLGLPGKSVHLTYGHPEINGSRIVTIVRDPRDCVLSWIRFSRGEAPTQGLFISHFREFDGGGSLVKQMSGFEPYLGDPSHLCLRFEEFIRNRSGMIRLAEYLGVPYLHDAFENLPGHTRTWYPTHCDYHLHWTPEVKRVWEAEGGRELIERWGYAWNS